MVEKLAERVEGVRKARALKPTKTDLVREFGEEGLKEGKREWRYEFKRRDGSVDMKKLHGFKEMMRPAERVEAALAESTAKPQEKPEVRRGPSVTVPALPWHGERRYNLAEDRNDG